MNRRAVLIGFAFSCSIACDRFELGAPADKREEVATPSTELASDAAEAAEVDGARAPEPSEAAVIAPTQPSPSESPASEPSPSEPPTVEPAISEPVGDHKAPPPMVGNAQKVLVALLAEIEVPQAAVKKDIKKRAWEDYLGYRYHEAGEGFALLTKLDPKSWEFPFTAARAAAGRLEMERAQVFLVEALLRGGTEARDKANKEPTLRATRKLPWFADLISADPAGLAAWEIREPPPLVIGSYEPGASPVGVRNVEIAAIEPSTKAYDSTKLRIAFDVEKLVAAGTYTGTLITTCKVGDRYLHDEVYIDLDDRRLPVDHSRRIETTRHDQEWNEPRSFDMCEVELIGWVGDPIPEYRWITRYCWTSAGVREGACSDFARPVTDDIEVTRVSVQPKVYENEPGVFIEWVSGRRPDRDARLAVHYVCEAEGRQIDSVEVFRRVADFARPGSALRASAMLQLRDRQPTRCDLEILRSSGGPRYIPSGALYCYEQGKTRAGRCGS
jgi:hypothetical protein